MGECEECNGRIGRKFLLFERLQVTLVKLGKVYLEVWKI